MLSDPEPSTTCPLLFQWSAALVGVVVSVAFWVLFQMVWTFLAPVCALFFGSMVAGRMAGTADRAVGMTHGLVVWAVTAILGMISLVLVLSAIQLPGALAGQVLAGAGAAMLVALIAALVGGALGAHANGRVVVRAAATR